MAALLLVAHPELRSTREEEDLADHIVGALRHTGYMELRELDFVVDGRRVHLYGRLPSYFLRQRAAQAILELPGVDSITDHTWVTN